MKEKKLKNKIITMKVGGIVLKNKEGFNQLSKIIEKYSDYNLLIVISAFSTATRELKESAQLAEIGEEIKANQIIDKIRDWHIEYAKTLLKNNAFDDLKQIIEQAISEIRKYLRGIAITKDLTPRTLDLIMSFGEFLALSTVHFYLVSLGIEHKSIDSRTFIVTNSDYGNAKPIIEITEKKIQDIVIPELQKYNIVITQGFVALSQQGEITTMGIESSNLTATLLAGLTNAEKLIIWTDTQGIRTSDPKIVPNANLIPSLNYPNAYSAGINGLKLIYPIMIEYAQKYNLKLEYRSAFNIDGEFTIISSKSKANNKLMIISKDNLNLIVIDRIKKLDEIELINHIRSNLKDLSYMTITPDYIKILTTTTHKKVLTTEKFYYKVFQNFAIITINNLKHNKENNFLDIIKQISSNYSATLMDYSIENSFIRLYLPGTYLNETIKLLSDLLER